jgi:small conductance mechanosensitive channel
MIWLLSATPDSLGHPADSLRNIARTIVQDVTTTQGLDKLQNAAQSLIEHGISLGLRILAALAIFIIGRFAIRLVNHLIKRILNSRDIDPSVKSFLESFINVTLLVLLIIAVVSKLGIETTSFAALLASFGVAVGMALSGNLQNFAGGILILIFRPYTVDDYVNVQDVEGTVTSIQIFHTVIRTYKGTNVYIPNGQMSNALIKNYSKEPLRMVEWIVSVEYGEDIKKVEDTVSEVIKADSRIQTVPEPYVAVKELAESSVNITIRVWTEIVNYWGVYFDGNKRIYETFNEKGINFPFPQLTIHQGT